MEVIEDGNIMDRIPILLQRDLEYYQKNQTVLSENICPSVVGGRLDFPRSASFAAVKIVLWLEEEFSIAFQQGSGMFVTLDDEKQEGGVVKTSDPDKFAQLATKSSDALLEHLHLLTQEALDHADLPVLTATLGAAALLKNSLYCYVQHVEDSGNTERHSILQACYKRYTTMFEAVGERVLDLHNRVLSLYILQDSGGRPIDDQSNTVYESGTPSVQGWWLYMNGSKKDLWDTVPPKMAQRIFAGMLNETLTILTVRYCQTNTTPSTTPLLVNDILNILLCCARLLPAVCAGGSDLAGLEPHNQSRDVRDVHAKCNELFKCMVYRGADLQYLHQAFMEEESIITKDTPYPWFTFVSPNLFDGLNDKMAKSSQALSTKTALGLEITVLLEQPQPTWALLVKVLMMRNCHLSSILLIHAMRNMSIDNSRWPADGLWYNVSGCREKCEGFLCTADGFCKFKGDNDVGEEYARTVGALTYILVTVGSKTELKSTLCYALEISGRDWAACLDKRQVWCDRRPPWLAGLLSVAGICLQFIPPILVNAILTGASMYQCHAVYLRVADEWAGTPGEVPLSHLILTKSCVDSTISYHQTMSLCLTCISRILDCVPRCLINAAAILEAALPSQVNPVGGSVLLQMLVTITYEELQKWSKVEMIKEKNVSNGEAHDMNRQSKMKSKQVRNVTFNRTMTSSVSFDGSHSSPSSIALAVAEALCSIDEDHKHTSEIEQLVVQTKKPYFVSDIFGLEDFPEFAEFFEEGNVPASNAERASDAAALTSQILMTSAGRDSLRVIYDHLQLHSEWIFKELALQEQSDMDISLNKAPLLYTMFHIGKRPFDQFLQGNWTIPWSKLVTLAKSWSGLEGAKVHVNRRADIRNAKTSKDKQVLELYKVFKSPPEGLL